MQVTLSNRKSYAVGMPTLGGWRLLLTPAVEPALKQFVATFMTYVNPSRDKSLDVWRLVQLGLAFPAMSCELIRACLTPQPELSEAEAMKAEDLIAVLEALLQEPELLTFWARTKNLLASAAEKYQEVPPGLVVPLSTT